MADSEPLRLVFAGGGTGGHLYPALALAEAFARQWPQVQTLFIGSAHGLESRVVPPLGHRLELIPVRGLLRKLTWSNLLVPVYLLQSVQRCRRLFRQFQPHLVIGTGGYVSGPALLAAWLRGTKFVIQEQNNYPGLVNRLLGRRAHAVFLSFEESRKYFPRQERVYVVGNPVRRQLRERTPSLRAAAARAWQLDAALTTLLVFGGSQGARRINQVMAELLPQLTGIDGLQVLWATGPAHFEQLAPLAAHTPRLRLVPYIEDMSLAYALADFVLCRAGASTIFELAACGLPAVLIPFPFATADHQTFNARAMVQAGAAVMIPERELRMETLLQTLRTLALDAGRRAEMAAAARRMARPHAADDIVALCLQLLQSAPAA
ncbi:MAG: undecaprenyldiphospho-muramoylpentapeptide beta-N-acetylglucosaminyltransferase [candidate division KSB1 bacterium]|nr:undecaprenyldiphospho-muramoylpentapeptide beta-N-acetylglucosaminyltransferase [candidate division KSB1 bacterium]MDZ7272448.1 undecaprenyldiphospho-muramoylpentapeptide beta-N-acetylglucosaminyltransferase [candidate division KSB1 bacterium]MDZ7284528.1 undecaprenyldiphospho-muramoylpentapeptide beta-N-acetylglucosaminyltransferase [candidate division KSB1 bacterium]MDZ7297076.1 undecaprenyldiphospho-muramoylpentapeptide beta-N-acetylglucosaminyltransferase [candidate division KSB1 bacteriu